jgi:exodeoxyribonuclease VII large subunit
MSEAPRLNLVEFTVSELAAALKRTVEDAYAYVRVRGEISGFRGRHASGHCYFALKDEDAKIEAVIWKSAFARMRIKPEDGLEVIATGRLSTYPSKSTYQIVVESLEPAGLGALMALLEQRKQKLAAEGLFDEARKQLLPFLPSRIGVVTSASGAVIRDILHRLDERFPRPVLVWPVRVQGEGSAAEVAAAIAGFNALPESGPLSRPDLIIVARGGGSLEDLWSFNEEVVVRAAAASMIPLISAVGHETDVTLIDFAADRRAPTPTAAAEMAVPVRAELLAQVGDLGRRNLACWRRGVELKRRELRGVTRAWPSAEALLSLARQRLDAAAERLPRALNANAQLHWTRYSRVSTRLTPQILRARIVRDTERVRGIAGRGARAAEVFAERRAERLKTLAARLQVALRANRDAHRVRVVRDRERVAALIERAGRALDALFDRRIAALERAGQVLAALSYQGVLARGFALVRDTASRPLRSVAAVSPGMGLDIEFADGHVGAVAETRHARAAAATPPRPRRRRSGSPDQGNLFGS